MSSAAVVIGALRVYSPVKLWGNLKQIATKGFYAVMIFLDLHFQHTKSRTKSENAKIIFSCVLFSKDFNHPNSYFCLDKRF